VASVLIAILDKNHFSVAESGHHQAILLKQHFGWFSRQQQSEDQGG
jgi:hypothetical protein